MTKNSFKTFSQKPADVERKWILIDATDDTLGRVANEVAKYLVGKHKVTFTPHVDGGDYVVVINAAKVKVTGDKEIAKRYWRHTGFPGGIKFRNLAEMRQKAPEQIIELAVKGMLPKNKLQAERMKRLKVYADENHNHAAQKPEKVEVK